MPSRSATERQDRADPLVHSQAEDLDREDVVEAVDDQAARAVPLGVDHPVGVGLAVQAEERASASATASSMRRAQNSGPGGSLLTRQEPQADLRPAVPEGIAEVLAVAVDDADQVAVIGRGGADRPLDHLAIDERCGRPPRGSPSSATVVRASGCGRGR